jgi:hypothetical protein
MHARLAFDDSRERVPAVHISLLLMAKELQTRSGHARREGAAPLFNHGKYKEE